MRKDLKTFIGVAGIDEVGRGPLAGPVTAATVVLPPDYSNTKIADSKKLSEKKRELLFDEISEAAEAYSIVSVGPRRIDKLNIRQASLLAMRLSAIRVYKKLMPEYQKPLCMHLLIDGNAEIETKLPQETIVKGDNKIVSIAAASILAKVTRDRLMKVLDDYYPGYGFEKHKGYPTKVHYQAIEKIGPSKVHRFSFRGVGSKKTSIQAPARAA